MPYAITDRDFYVRAGIKVYKHDIESKRYTVIDPIIYCVGNKQIQINKIGDNREVVATITGEFTIDSFRDKIKKLKTIVKFANFNSDRNYRYKKALADLNLTDIKSLVKQDTDNKNYLNIQIVICLSTLANSVRSNLMMSTFKFRVMDDHPDQEKAKPLTFWIDFDSIGPVVENKSPIESGVVIPNSFAPKNRLLSLSAQLDNLYFTLSRMYDLDSNPTIGNVFELKGLLDTIIINQSNATALDVCVQGVREGLTEEENTVRIVSLVLSSHIENMKRKSNVDKNDIQTLYTIINGLNIKELSKKLKNRAQTLIEQTSK